MTVPATAKVQVQTEEFDAFIAQDLDSQKWVLEWNDHIINDWEEEFGSLADALTRLAVLVYGAEQGNGFAFARTRPAHILASRNFLAAQVEVYTDA